MNHEIFLHFVLIIVSKFKQQAKQKQALLESNLPGIVCSTGMVKWGWRLLQPLLFGIIPRVYAFKKLILRTLYSITFGIVIQPFQSAFYKRIVI
jgi:hypothetical protein